MRQSWFGALLIIAFVGFCTCRTTDEVTSQSTTQTIANAALAIDKMRRRLQDNAVVEEGYGDTEMEERWRIPGIDKLKALVGKCPNTAKVLEMNPAVAQALQKNPQLRKQAPPPNRSES
ncbi:hypothetical protein PC128_g15331 [Phytophthora cactorum]|nr:hypothetical protein PC120_g7854 [Phytophthora cactorum]KAG3069055.1 hypothetical protein PC121_g9959 [Phytophthora cactorum]KAG3180986.1 hypothetical protein PC128_g15331 [Phytophthora cactorum]